MAEPLNPLEALDTGAVSAPVEPGNGVALVGADGAQHVAAPTEAAGLVRSGKFTFAQGQKLGVKDEGGRVKVVSAEEAMGHLANGGELAGSKEVERHERHELYGDAGGMAAAGGEALARGVTFGLSDRAALAAAHAYGGDAAQEATRLHLKGGQEENPYLAGGAELVGNIAPALLTGGASEAAEGASLLSRGIRAAGAIPRTVDEVAGLGGAAMRGLVGEGESLGGRVAKSALEHGTTGAFQGAALNFAQVADESALNGGDHELTAEQLLAAAGHGALTGGLLGGGIGGGVEAASEGVSRVAAKAAEAMGEGSVRDFLEGIAKKHAFKSIGADLNDTRYANQRIKGGPEAVSKFVLDELPEAAGKPFKTMTLRDMNEAASKVKGEAFAKLDSHLDEFDKMDPALRPKTDEILTKLRGVADEVRGKVGQEPLAAHLDDVIDSIGRRLEAGGEEAVEAKLPAPKPSDAHAYLMTPEGKKALSELIQKDPSVVGVIQSGGIPRGLRIPGFASGEAADVAARKVGTVGYRELRNVRVELDDLINKGKSGGLVTSPLQQELTKMRWGIEETMMDAAEKAGGERGAAMKADYQAAKQQAHIARFVEDTTADKLQRVEQTNAGFGLRATAMAAGALASGHIGGAALAGIGAQALIGRGDQIVAGMANRLAHLAAVQRTTQGVTQLISSATRGYISRAAETATVPLATRMTQGRSDRSLREGYEKTAANVRELAANPAKMAEAQATQLGSLPAHAPTVAGAVARKAAQVNAYLASKLPAPTPGNSLLQPLSKGPPPSDGQMADFMRIAAIATNPLGILSELRRNRITQDQVDTVKELAPKLYQQIQQSTMEAVVNRKEPLPYEKRKTLGILLSIPTDPILQPDVVRGLQASYAAPDTGEPPPGGKGHGKAPHLKAFAQSASSDLDAAESRSLA